MRHSSPSRQKLFTPSVLHSHSHLRAFKTIVGIVTENPVDCAAAAALVMAPDTFPPITPPILRHLRIHFYYIMLCNTERNSYASQIKCRYSSESDGKHVLVTENGNKTIRNDDGI
jgi:hypothetical protein